MSNGSITIPCWAVFAVDLVNDKVDYMALNKDKVKAESDARERADRDGMLSTVPLAVFNVGQGAKKIRAQIVSWLWEIGLYGADVEHVIQIIEEQVVGAVVHLMYEMDRQDRRDQ